METKQTAIEWLIEAIELQKITIVYSDKILSVSVPLAIAEQAKQMEKEQILDAYYQCGRDNFEHIKVINRSATDYYNETYGKETNRS